MMNISKLISEGRLPSSLKELSKSEIKEKCIPLSEANRLGAMNIGDSYVVADDAQYVGVCERGTYSYNSIEPDVLYKTSKNNRLISKYKLINGGLDPIGSMPIKEEKSMANNNKNNKVDDKVIDSMLEGIGDAVNSASVATDSKVTPESSQSFTGTGDAGK